MKVKANSDPEGHGISTKKSLLLGIQRAVNALLRATGFAKLGIVITIDATSEGA